MLSIGKIGEGGVAIDSWEDMKLVLDGFRIPEIMARSGRTLQAIEGVVRGLSRLPGRKAVVLVSDGFDAELAADFEGEGRFVLPRPLQERELDRVLEALESRHARGPVGIS